MSSPWTPFAERSFKEKPSPTLPLLLGAEAVNLDSKFSFDTHQLDSPFLPPVQPKKIPWLGKTWEQCAGLREVSTPLAELPAGVEFPSDFPEPIRFDAARKTLAYRGFMSHTSFMELQKLSNAFAYGRALEALFTASAIPAETLRPRFPFVLAIIGASTIGLIAAIAYFVMR